MSERSLDVWWGASGGSGSPQGSRAERGREAVRRGGRLRCWTGWSVERLLQQGGWGRRGFGRSSARWLREVGQLKIMSDLIPAATTILFQLFHWSSRQKQEVLVSYEEKPVGGGG